MRSPITVAVVAVGLAGFAAPAIAANQTVHAVGARSDEYGTFPDLFQPTPVRVLPGESVTWVNDQGTHNVKFEDGQFEAPADPAPPESWPATPPRRSFPQAGTYRFYCEMHGAPGGFGMSGVVLVGQTASPPNGTPGTGTGSPGGAPGTDANIESLALTRPRFCNRRGPRCRRPGVRLRIDLSAPARVKGVLKRRALNGQGKARRFGALDFGTVGAGRRLLRFQRTKSGRRLTRGRYALMIRAGRDSQVLRFKVVS
jgi:plastocyanin